MKSPNVKPIIGVLMLLAILVAVATSHSESQPASKGIAKAANLTWLPKTTRTGDCQTLQSNVMRTAN